MFDKNATISIEPGVNPFFIGFAPDLLLAISYLLKREILRKISYKNHILSAKIRKFTQNIG